MTRLRTSTWMLLGAIALGSVAPVAAHAQTPGTSSSSPWTGCAGRSSSAAPTAITSNATRRAVPASRSAGSGARLPRSAARSCMPFVWTTMAVRGQVFGDPSARSAARFTNGLWFSYPGYSEMLAGVTDPRVDSNRKVPNPNVTVLECLNRRPSFAGRVAAFGSWDVLPFILSAERAGLPVGTGWTPVPAPSSERERAINELAADLPRYWDYGPFDAPIVYAALEAVADDAAARALRDARRTDEWAHEGRYDLYLDATLRADRFVERIWTRSSRCPIRGPTALVLTTDHGRGSTTGTGPITARGAAAERAWIAVMGPGVRRSAFGVTSPSPRRKSRDDRGAGGGGLRKAVPAAAPPIALAR